MYPYWLGRSQILDTLIYGRVECTIVAVL
jgi:hypothetical protein